jgi:hypothetical protein
MNGIKSYGRCPTCGRFVKRGLWNMIKHSEICPERELLILLHGFKVKIVKYKNYEQFTKG